MRCNPSTSLLRASLSSSAPAAAAADVPTVKNFINGEFVESTTDQWIDLTNPATNEVIGRVPQSTDEEMKAAVSAAEDAFKTWGQTPVS